jgi:hypothetical protein
VSIKPNFTSHIIPWFVDLDECANNEPNATFELWYGGAQFDMLIYYEPLKLILNCIIDVRCNENGIITNYTL